MRFEIGDSEQIFPYHWIEGAKNFVFQLNFDPMFVQTDGQDGCERQQQGNGPYGTADIKVFWCKDYPLNSSLQHLREGKDTITEAAVANSSHLAPKFQDGHGWCYVHPNHWPKVGPVINKVYLSLGTEEFSNLSSLL